MELENVTLNGENVVVSNLINSNLLFLKIVKIEYIIQDHMLFFLIRCHDCPKNKIPHIVHLINQH
jgi:hypothetical protein